MKVLLVSDYFYPFTPGGSEWSVYELAETLKTNGDEPIVVSINYGDKDSEVFHGIQIIRIPFIKKITKVRSTINPIWQNNPLFFLMSAYYLYKFTKEKRPDVINVHGKFLIPGSIIAGYFTKKPVIVTIRDKQILCPIGKCFFNSKRLKACSFFEYLTSDFPWFSKNYTNGSLISIAYALAGTVWSRIAGNIIKIFAKQAHSITTISNSQKHYLETNGFRNVKVIYNTANFKTTQSRASKSKTVLFVGKLSKGKGVELLLDTAEQIVKTHNVKFIFAGSNQSKVIKNRLNQKSLNAHVKLLGGVEHRKLPKLYRRSSCVIMPSIYPESFGRSALESLSFGTPVVVTNTGALPEIVDNKITGRISEPSVASLKEAILDVLENEEKYRNNIIKKYHFLREKFMLKPTHDYLALYKASIQ